MGTYLVPLGSSEPKVYAIYEVSLVDCTKVLSFRSNTLIINETGIPLSVEVERVNSLHHHTMAPIAPGDSTAVPIWPAKSAANCLRFRPGTMEGGQPTHEWSETPIGCTTMAKNSIIRCPSLEKTGQPFFLAVSVDVKTEPNVREDKDKEGDHIVRVAAPLVVENVLLEPMEFRLFDDANDIVYKASLDRGEQIALHQFDVNSELKLSITVPGYRRSKLRAITGAKIKRMFQCSPHSPGAGSVELNMHNRVTARGVRKVSVYAQFWMINRTGLPLAYQQAPVANKSVPDSVRKKWQDLVGGDPAEWYKQDGGDGFGSGEQYTQLSRPVMFAFHKRDIVGNKASLKIADSKWSKPFSLESAGYSGVLEISDRKKHYGEAKKVAKSKRVVIAFQLCVAIELAPSKFRRTKVVTVSPLFVLINMIDKELSYMQSGLKDMSFTLPPNGHIPFHWPDGNRKACREISIKLGPLWSWSGSFAIDQVGEQVVKHRHRHGDVSLTKVEVRAEQGTIFVIFYPEISVPPYCIHNFTPYTLTIYQKEGGTPQKLAPYDRVSYCWDEPSNRHYLAVEMEDTVPEFQKEYCLDKIKQYKPIRVLKGGKKIHIAAETSTDGPTRVLKIIDQTVHDTSSQCAADLPVKIQEDIKKNATTTVRITVHDGIGISLIDATPQEIMYICVQDLALEYCNSDYYLKEYIYFTVARFQVDNQLFFTPFPVVAAPHLKLPFDKPFIKLTVIKSHDYKAIDYYKYLAVSLQEVDVSIDEVFLLRLFAFANIDAQFGTSEKPLETILNQQGLAWPKPSNTEGTRKMYFELLHINPIQVNLSFVTVPAKDESEENPVRWAIGTLGIGVKIPNIDNAPIRLNALILQHPFATRTDMLHRITAYYQQQAILEAYKVLGSFDFLGNPVSLVSSLGTGVKDFFYAPYLAVVNNPRDLGEGLGKGTSSLLKKSIYGLTNSVSKVTDTVAKGVSKLALSKDYVIERDHRDREAPKNVGEGLLYGARDLGKGVLGGVTGVFVDPVVGARNDGASGLIKGVAQGVLGVAVRPSVGVLDVFTKTTRGIRNQTDDIDRRGRVRLRYPRYFGRDKLLEIYSEEKAYGQAVLYTLCDNRYVNEWYCFHECISNHAMVLVSNKGVILVTVDDGKCKKEWRVRLCDIQTEGVEKVAEGVQLSLEPKRGSISYLSGVSFQGFQKTGGKKVLRRLIEVKSKRKREDIYHGIIDVIQQELLSGTHNWIELYTYN